MCADITEVRSSCAPESPVRERDCEESCAAKHAALNARTTCLNPIYPRRIVVEDRVDLCVAQAELLARSQQMCKRVVICSAQCFAHEPVAFSYAALVPERLDSKREVRQGICHLPFLDRSQFDADEIRALRELLYER